LIFVRLIFLLVGLVCWEFLWAVSLGVLQVMVKVRKKRVRKGEKLAGVGCAAVDRRGENVKKKELLKKLKKKLIN
jgi:hypothetical protein